MLCCGPWSGWTAVLIWSRVWRVGRHSCGVAVPPQDSLNGAEVDEYYFVYVCTKSAADDRLARRHDA